VQAAGRSVRHQKYDAYFLRREHTHTNTVMH